MFMNTLLFMIIAISAVRTICFGIYTLKNDGIIAGISAFILSAGTVFGGAVIFFRAIMR